MNKINVEMYYNEKLWKQINSEMDGNGKIYIDDDLYIQVLPLENANFMPEFEPLIEFVVSIPSQLALNLVASWIYDKMKQYKTKKVKINDKEHIVESKKAIEIAVNISINKEYEVK